MSKLKQIPLPCILVAVLIIVMLLPALLPDSGDTVDVSRHLGQELPLWSCLPFVGMLLSLAIFPLAKPVWWEKNLLYVALFWGLLFLLPFGLGFGAQEAGAEFFEVILLDYLPFIVLLWGLFAVSGGIVLKGSLGGSPKVNIALLLVGTILASWIGTTGASMLLIRPVLRANKWRRHKVHVVVFFIFLVSNIGGCLTPIGDPPLFLGFMRGVPFFWTMQLLPILLFNVVVLLAAFFALDRRYYKKDLALGLKPDAPAAKEPLRIDGLHNLIFIVMIVGAVILSGTLAGLPTFTDPSTGAALGIPFLYDITVPFTSVIQMAIILAAGILSIATTHSDLHNANNHTWEPIKEIAYLFLGIFITMIPALALLGAHGGELGLQAPWQFFWASGVLSSFLDNAPTYLVFLTTAGSLGSDVGVATTVGTIAPGLLIAISAGAVFMGANTYIGNAPNFMVRSIAEENGVKMPHFFAYMAWSLSVLIPLFILDTLVFFLF